MKRRHFLALAAGGSLAIAGESSGAHTAISAALLALCSKLGQNAELGVYTVMTSATETGPASRGSTQLANVVGPPSHTGAVVVPQ